MVINNPCDRISPIYTQELQEDSTYKTIETTYSICYVCKACGSQSPVGHGETEQEALDAAYSLAKRIPRDFLDYMAKQNGVKAIGIIDDLNVEISTTDQSLSTINDVIEAYCEWWRQNTGKEYFDIKTVSDNEFERTQYAAIIHPKDCDEKHKESDGE
jgi:hypothetical protein